MSGQKHNLGIGFSLGGNQAKKPKPNPPSGVRNIFAADDEKPTKLPPSALLSEEEFRKFKPADNVEEEEAPPIRKEVSPLPPMSEFRERKPKMEPIPQKSVQEEDEVDPLDAFMMGVQEDMKKEKKPEAKLRREDIEEEDPMESFLKFRKEKHVQQFATTDGNNSDEEVYATAHAMENEEIEYDENGNPINNKKEIGPIAPLDHSQIEYPEFNKDFYEEHPEIAAMTDQEVKDYRVSLGIQVSGVNVPKPVKTFEHLQFDQKLALQIIKQEYEEPTSIQKQALPVALSGRDIIGIAKTGSGKTASYVWPMLVHIMDQHELEKGDGPIAIIVSPTRELADQIYIECKKFAKGYGIKCAAIFGGTSKGDQFVKLKHGAEVVICTPVTKGRLIDMIKSKICKMNRVTYLVLDEADRMFDLGFEPQIQSIVGQIRPDRQTTFKKKIEGLARDILTDPVRITVGAIGEANQDIHQEVVVFNDASQKFGYLLPRLVGMVAAGSVLIFVSQKATAEELATKLNEKKFHAAAIHGDKDQADRNKIMFAFKNQNLPILVATDVAARGLDIRSIKNVVNYEVARNIDAHTHRIGRTGRAGDHGVATTFVTKKDANFAGDLVRNLEGANQIVPEDLLELAMQNPWFLKQRQRFGGGKGGGKGLGAGGGRVASRGRGKGIGFDSAPAPKKPGEAKPSVPFTLSGGYNRNALMSQFQSSFKASSDDSMISNWTPKPQPPTPTPSVAPKQENNSKELDKERDSRDSRDRDRNSRDKDSRDSRDRDSRDSRDRDRDSRDSRDRDRDSRDSRDRDRDSRDSRDRDSRDSRDRDSRDSRDRDSRDSRDRRDDRRGSSGSSRRY